MAKFNVNCPHCGTTLEVQDEWTGKAVRCPGCQNSFTVPGGSANSAPVMPSVPANEFPMNCPHCGSTLMVKNEWLGMELSCPNCQNSFTVPGGGADSAPVMPPAPPDEFPMNCPHCGSMFNVKNEWLGMELSCPFCREYFRIPPNLPGMARSKHKTMRADNPLKDAAMAGIGTRWIARSLDNVLGFAALFFFVNFLMNGTLIKDLAEIFSTPKSAQTNQTEAIFPVMWAIFLPFVMLAESIVYAIFGGTIGKWLFGVRIVNAKREPIRGGEYFKRNFMVYFSAYGMGLPLISLITMLIQRSRVLKRSSTSYDESLGFEAVEYGGNIYKTLIGVIGFFLVSGLFGYLVTQH